MLKLTKLFGAVSGFLAILCAVMLNQKLRNLDFGGFIIAIGFATAARMLDFDLQALISQAKSGSSVRSDLVMAIEMVHLEVDSRAGIFSGH